MLNMLLGVIISGILIGAIYALISLGLNIIFGVMGIINMAHGEIIMLACYITFWLYALFAVDPFIGSALGIPFYIVFSIAIYYLVINPIIKRGELPTIIATYGLSIFLIAFSKFLWTSDYRYISLPYSSIIVTGISISLPRLIGATIAVILTFILWLIYKKTFLGMAIRAVATDREAASLMGINIKKVYLYSFIIGILATAVGGALIAAIYPIYPEMGGPFTLIAFLIVIIGGLGSFTGTILSGFLIGLVEALTGYIVGVTWTGIVVFLLTMIILIIRSKETI